MLKGGGEWWFYLRNVNMSPCVSLYYPHSNVFPGLYNSHSDLLSDGYKTQIILLYTYIESLCECEAEKCLKIQLTEFTDAKYMMSFCFTLYITTAENETR